MRNKTEREGDQGDAKPNPPSALPKMIIQQGCCRTNHQPYGQPKSLTFDKKIDIAMAVACKRARAKKHDNADDKHAKHGDKQDISAFTMH